MLTVLSNRRRVCNGLTRRELLQAGGAGLFGLSLPQVLAAEAAQQPTKARAKSVIFALLYGGPGQFEWICQQVLDACRGIENVGILEGTCCAGRPLPSSAGQDEAPGVFPWPANFPRFDSRVSCGPRRLTRLKLLASNWPRERSGFTSLPHRDPGKQ